MHELWTDTWKSQNLEDIKCTSCTKLGGHFITCLTLPPNILCLRVARDNQLGKNNCKITSFEIPNYQIVSVIEHHGETTGNGHYTSSIKTTTGWTNYNDAIVTKSAQIPYNCYLAFYKNNAAREKDS